MSKYQNVSNEFMLNKTLGFLRNFVGNHNDNIKNDFVFGILDDFMSQEMLMEILEENLPEKDFKWHYETTNKREIRPYSNSNDIHEQWGRIWNNAHIRPHAKKILLDIADENIKSSIDTSTDVFCIRFNELANKLQLSDFEADILLIMLACEQRKLGCTYNKYGSPLKKKVDFFAKCLDCDFNEVLFAVGADQKLQRFGLIDGELDFEMTGLDTFLHGLENTSLSDKFYTKSEIECLPWHYYGKSMQENGEILEEIISKNGSKNGVNILLYGEPGTGKTSFAHSIAAKLNLDCYLIKQSIEEKKESDCSTNFRFSALKFCANQVDPTQSLIIIDEADNMLENPKTLTRNTKPSEKGRLNTVLDNNNIPTIWISNNQADDIDESSRRRFDYSIYFGKFNTEQRLTIWKNSVKKMNLESLFSLDMLETLAQKYATNAGGIALALKNIKNIQPSKDSVISTIDKLLKVHCELLEIEVSNDKLLPSKEYQLDGLNIKGGVKLERIIDAVRNFQTSTNSPDSPRMNLLLSGVPGSGKTEFIKYLSCQLNTKLVIKSGSDLLSKYVGETEHNIKRAFADAEHGKSILFLDEIDGLTQSREQSKASWEVTQVNELLQQIENFNGIFIGATNFLANLDSALLRRFTFKLEFDYLDNEGKIKFFEKIFKTKLSDAERTRLDNIPRLTPGDYRTVRQSLFYLNNNASNNERLSCLEQESNIKSKHKFSEKKIGFIQ